MESILQWGLDFIRSVQSIANPPLTFFFKMITQLGGEMVFMVLLPIFFWCIDEKKGLRLGLAVLIAAWLNMALKYLLDQPRPFFEGYDPSLGMISERMGGFPSGHAMNTMVCLFVLASFIKKNWAYITAAVLCLLISFSRIYLGVHFPTDILGGWFFGGIVLCGYFLLGDKIAALLKKGGFRLWLIATAVVSFLLILYIPSRSILMPGGIIFGFGIGFSFNLKYVGYTTNAWMGKTGSGKVLLIAARMAIGIAGFLLIYLGLGGLIPEDSSIVILLTFIQLALMGLWVSIIAPWIFVKLKLAGPAVPMGKTS